MSHSQLDGGRIGDLSALPKRTRGLSALHEWLERGFEGIAQADRK